MSHQASYWALEQTCSTATEKAILMVIASYVGPDGCCYPGQDTLARQACCSVKSVERALQAFEDRGWLTRTARRRKDGSRTSDLLELTLAPNPEVREQADTVSGCAQPTRHPVQTNPTPCPNQPDRVSGLTTFEPVRTEPVRRTAVVVRASEHERPPPLEGEVLPPTKMDGPSDWPPGDARHHAEMLVDEAATVHLDPARQPGLATTTGRIHAWRRDGASWEHDVLPVVRAAAQRQRGPIRSWKFFDAAIAQSIADNRAALAIPAARANAGRSPDAGLAGQSARRENRERASAGAGWASEVMAARRSL